MGDGIALGALTWLGYLLTFQHLPGAVKGFLLRHYVLTEILASGMSFVFLTGISKSLVAAEGAIVCGLLTEASFILHKKFIR